MIALHNAKLHTNQLQYLNNEIISTLISVHDLLLKLRDLGISQYHLSFQGGYLLVHFVYLKTDLRLVPILCQPGQLFDWWAICFVLYLLLKVFDLFCNVFPVTEESLQVIFCLSNTDPDL